MAYTIKDFNKRDRIEMHPATDTWMRGLRYGEVVSVGRSYVMVKLDNWPKPIRVAPQNIGQIIV